MKPLRSATFIASLSKNVKIDEKNLVTTADWVRKNLKEKQYDFKVWKQHELHPKVADKSAVDWIFVVDCLNFSFWSDSRHKRWHELFNGKQYSGYWGLCAAINRAIQENIPITDPSYYCNISKGQLKHIFKGKDGVEIPLLDKRLQILHEAGSVLLEKYEGSFVNCVLNAHKKSEKLLDIIVNNFPSFRDEAIYNDTKVSFYKRAQILIADIWACFEGEGIGSFEDIENLTMFADYRVPQVLAHFGVLKYSEALTARLMKDEVMENGDSDEVEIRGLSILAVQQICDEINRKEPQLAVNPITVDYYLWDYRRQYSEEIDKIPFHKVRSIFY